MKTMEALTGHFGCAILLPSAWNSLGRWFENGQPLAVLPMINSDFADLLCALNDENAKYLIVGGIALAFHDRPRFTKDLDLFIDRSAENAVRIYRALGRFGAPLDGLSIEDLQSPELVFQIGVDPVRVIPVHVIARSDLIANKLATGRSQDLADIERLRTP